MVVVRVVWSVGVLAEERSDCRSIVRVWVLCVLQHPCVGGGRGVVGDAKSGMFRFSDYHLYGIDRDIWFLRIVRVPQADWRLFPWNTEIEMVRFMAVSPWAG